MTAFCHRLEGFPGCCGEKAGRLASARISPVVVPKVRTEDEKLLMSLLKFYFFSRSVSHDALDKMERRLPDKTLADFQAAGLFRAMDGLPVVIRLIDPPLHEFLPSHDELLAKVTRLRTLLEMPSAPTDAVASADGKGKATAAGVNVRAMASARRASRSSR